MHWRRTLRQVCCAPSFNCKFFHAVYFCYPHGLRSARRRIDGNGPGLGLLPLVTLFEPAKTVRHTEVRLGELAPGPWAKLSGVQVTGYEIHHGQTAQHPAMAAAGDVAREVVPGLVWQNRGGNVLGLYLHGLLEDPAVLQALFGRPGNAPVRTLDAVFDGLADAVEAHFVPGVLQALVAPRGAAMQER